MGPLAESASKMLASKVRKAETDPDLVGGISEGFPTLRALLLLLTKRRVPFFWFIFLGKQENELNNFYLIINKIIIIPKIIL